MYFDNVLGKADHRKIQMPARVGLAASRGDVDRVAPKVATSLNIAATVPTYHRTYLLTYLPTYIVPTYLLPDSPTHLHTYLLTNSGRTTYMQDDGLCTRTAEVSKGAVCEGRGISGGWDTRGILPHGPEESTGIHFCRAAVQHKTAQASQGHSSPVGLEDSIYYRS